MIKNSLILLVLIFIIKKQINTQDYELINVKINNFLKGDSLTIDALKLKKCFRNIEIKNTDFEIYDSCFSNDSISVFINKELVYDGKTKNRYSSSNLSDELLYKIPYREIKFPLNVSIFYHDYKKRINFIVPKGTKRVIILSYLSLLKTVHLKKDDAIKIFYRGHNLKYDIKLRTECYKFLGKTTIDISTANPQFPHE